MKLNEIKAVALNSRKFKIVKCVWTGMSAEDQKKYASGLVLAFGDLPKNSQLTPSARTRSLAQNLQINDGKKIETGNGVFSLVLTRVEDDAEVTFSK
jgi:hypothetical protein